jgi:hypothetical protein
LGKARGEKGLCRASLQLQRAHKEDQPVVFLQLKRLTHPCDWLSLALGGQPRHCGERFITDDDAVRKSIARRSAFKRLPAFKRAAASVRLEFFE